MDSCTMGGRRTFLMCLVASIHLVALSVAKVDSRFLTSVKPEDTTPHKRKSGALTMVSKEEGLAAVANQKDNGVKVHTTEQASLGKEGEKGEFSEDTNFSGKVKQDQKEQSTAEEKTTKSQTVEKMDEKEKDEEEKPEEAHLSEQMLTDLLHWYLFPHLSIRPQQRILPPLPISLPSIHHAGAPPPLFPVTLKWSPFPALPPSLLARTPPSLFHRPPVPSSDRVPETELEDSLSKNTALRGAEEDLQISTSLESLPLATWLKLVANALSDEVYQRYVQRQASSPDPGSASSPEQKIVLKETNSAGERIEGLDLKSEFKDKPSKLEMPVKPLPAFKVNKSMRPYVTTPIPISPFYTFDKPPHFFPPSHLPPSQEPNETQEIGAETTESTPSEVAPIANGVASDD